LKKELYTDNPHILVALQVEIWIITLKITFNMCHSICYIVKCA